MFIGLTSSLRRIPFKSSGDSNPPEIPKGRKQRVVRVAIKSLQGNRPISGEALECKYLQHKSMLYDSTKCTECSLCSKLTVLEDLTEARCCHIVSNPLGLFVKTDVHTKKF